MSKEKKTMENNEVNDIKFPDVSKDNRLPYARWTSIMRKTQNWVDSQNKFNKKDLTNE